MFYSAGNSTIFYSGDGHCARVYELYCFKHGDSIGRCNEFSRNTDYESNKKI